MSRYLLRRLCAALLVMFAVVTATFLIAHAIPADPARAAAGLHAGPAQVQAAKAQLGLDKSTWQQYVSYLGDIVHGRLGISYASRAQIAPTIRKALPATAELVVCTFVLYAVLGVLSGIFLAWAPRNPLSYLVRLGSVLGTSLPVFWFAIVLQLWVAARWHWLPINGRLSFNASPPENITGFYTLDSILTGNWAALGDALEHLVLPAVSLLAWMYAIATRVSEKAVADELDREYVRTAVAKGVGDGRLIWRHVLRNALNPIITILGLQFGWLLGGTVLVEVVFSWGGIGSLLYTALQTFDYPVIVAVTLVITAGFVLVNLLVDLLYPVLDPRVRRA